MANFHHGAPTQYQDMAKIVPSRSKDVSTLHAANGLPRFALSLRLGDLMSMVPAGEGGRYFTPDIIRTVGLISRASTTAAAMLKTATEPNSVGRGIEL